MGVELNEISRKAMGGTELMAHRINLSLPKDLLDQFQIIPSRVRELDPTRIRILYCHDLPQDPESEHLKNGGWKKFHRIVFVSYWQREWYVRHFQIPYHRTAVIQNAIPPIELKEKANDKVNIIYHTTPHRGLDILVPVFQELAKEEKDIHLDVSSSFGIYGWEDRDKPFEKLFDAIKSDPNMTYHGFQPNQKVREALQKAHIFAYPNTWMETSCLSLIEAMSAGCHALHPDLGALPETAAGWTMMYGFHEDKNEHANIFYQALRTAINIARENSEGTQMKVKGAKSYCDIHYNCEIKKAKWEAYLKTLLDLPRDIEKNEEYFVYRV